MLGNTSLWVGHLSHGPKEWRSERRYWTFPPKCSMAIEFSGAYCWSIGDSMIYHPIWNIFDDAKMLTWIGWWSKRNKLGQSQPNQDLLIILDLSISQPPNEEAFCPPLCIRLHSPGCWNARGVLVGARGKHAHGWELAFCIWFRLRNVCCPK